MEFDRKVLQAQAFHQQGRFDQAERLYEEVLRAQPQNFEALHLLGVLRAQQGSPQAAVKLISAAIQHRGDSAEAHSDLGIALASLGQEQEALASFDRALALNPNHWASLLNRGTVLIKLGRYDEARATIDRALALRPEAPDALVQLGHLTMALKRPREAIAIYDKLVRLQPLLTDAAYQRGNALMQENRPREALAALDQALAFKPDHVQALNSRGVALHRLANYEEAIATFDRALAIKAEYADALSNRAGSLARAGRFKEAISDYEKAAAVAPEYPYAIGNVLMNKRHICDWANHDRLVGNLCAEVRAGKRVANPFTFLAVTGDAADQRMCAEARVVERFSWAPGTSHRKTMFRHERIRIGYFSADFHDHATAYLMAELFELHDRKRFEITGISFGPDSRHEMRSRLEKSFDRFVNAREMSDQDVAALAKSGEIDIAVDLKGYTRESRPEIFAFGAAPIQVSYLGYPGTMAAPFIDYILADETVIPREQQAHYSEKVVYLPDCYQVNDSKRLVGERVPARREAGLPDDGFVFCCFNNSYKLTPQMFDIWMRLLRSVEGSVLWLYQNAPDTITNLRREAEARGVSGERLIFAAKVGLEEHLARHRLADLFVDTLPYNAHTTASDALWTGLPVVTCAGSSFAGRVAASLLLAIDLPELVTHSLEDYEALALKLATDRALLRDVRDKLARNRTTAPLFDTDRFRRHLEAAFRTMWEIQQRGEAPRAFTVPPVPKPGLK